LAELPGLERFWFLFFAALRLFMENEGENPAILQSDPLMGLPLS